MTTMKRIGKLITGSLACMISLVMIITPQAALAASSLDGLPEPEGVSQIEASKGVVRLQSGTTDDEGKFTAKNTFSGFVVSGDGSGSVFIVTTWHSVNVGDNPVVTVTVKNDTTTEAGIVAYSSEQDFCLLSSDSMKGKTALPLRIPEYDEEGADDALKEGSDVKALGFSADAGSGTEFSSADVRTSEGTVGNLALSKDSAKYVSHNAALESGMDGGPLVDENGYVIGVNNAKKSADGVYNALQIQEVDKLLDSNGIQHRTRDKDLLYKSLYELCGDAEGAYKSVKKDYKEDILTSYQNAVKVMSETAYYDRNAMQSAYTDLKAKIDNAEYKTPKSLIMIGVLGAVIIALAAKLISLIMWNRNFEKSGGTVPEKKPKERREKKKKSGSAGRAGGSAAISTAATSHPTGARLTVRRTGAVYEIDKNIVTMGRSPEADVTIEDNVYVARMHAMVEDRKGVYFLHDMGTTNGTYLNGQKVVESGIRLVPGDIIGLGNEEIEFR